MSLTADQIAALSEKTSEAKLCVEIDATSPIRYCSGQNPAQVSGDWYEPRWIGGSVFDLTSPQNARTQIAIDDRDKALEVPWYTDRFSGYDVSIHVLLRTPPEKTWTLAASVVWQCEKAEPSKGNMIVKLFGAGGHRKRFGLVVGNISLFPYAPTADERFSFGGGAVTVLEPRTTLPWWYSFINQQDPPSLTPTDIVHRTPGRRVADDGSGG